MLAFDLGGTDSKTALVDETGRLLDVVRTPTPQDKSADAGAIFSELERLAKGIRQRHPEVPIKAVGLMVPGYVDDVAGTGVYSENLGWRAVPFRDRLSTLLDLPVAFGHDVRAAGLAEFRLGAAQPFSDVVVMTIGTGIAAAIFLRGELYAGGGLAGENGHSIVADGPECACGGRGCLEAVASAGAIARRYNAATGSSLPGAREVLERIRHGDLDASKVWESALDALALDLSHTVALLAPEAIVIGGGLAGAGDALFEPLRERLDALLTFQRRPQLIPATIGENAGVVGSALAARDLLEAAAS
ncbi:ROK family protein [Salinibacterium sp. G-O1]|nr:ROK family protein [Salinibacterium sp. G-O1]MDJ0334555.1 ROK family protein [Salinibacterium sp. G-O1]